VTLPDQKERERRDNLRRLAECYALLYSRPSREQQEAAAKALGRYDLLPDAQGGIELEAHLGR
jgi:hypothetical protein